LTVIIDRCRRPLIMILLVFGWEAHAVLSSSISTDITKISPKDRVLKLIESLKPFDKDFSFVIPKELSLHDKMKSSLNQTKANPFELLKVEQHVTKGINLTRSEWRDLENLLSLLKAKKKDKTLSESDALKNKLKTTLDALPNKAQDVPLDLPKDLKEALEKKVDPKDYPSLSLGKLTPKELKNILAEELRDEEIPLTDGIKLLSSIQDLLEKTTHPSAFGRLNKIAGGGNGLLDSRGSGFHGKNKDSLHGSGQKSKNRPERGGAKLGDFSPPTGAKQSSQAPESFSEIGKQPSGQPLAINRSPNRGFSMEGFGNPTRRVSASAPSVTFIPGDSVNFPNLKSRNIDPSKNPPGSPSLWFQTAFSDNPGVLGLCQLTVTYVDRQGSDCTYYAKSARHCLESGSRVFDPNRDSIVHVGPIKDVRPLPPLLNPLSDIAVLPFKADCRYENEIPIVKDRTAKLEPGERVYVSGDKLLAGTAEPSIIRGKSFLQARLDNGEIDKGNSGGGIFTENENGELELAGVISSKIVDARNPNNKRFSDLAFFVAEGGFEWAKAKSNPNYTPHVATQVASRSGVPSQEHIFH